MCHTSIGNLFPIVRVIGAANNRILTQCQLGYSGRARALKYCLIRAELTRVVQRFLPAPDMRLIKNLQIPRPIVHRHFFLPFRIRAIFPGQFRSHRIRDQLSVIIGCPPFANGNKPRNDPGGVASDAHPGRASPPSRRGWPVWLSEPACRSTRLRRKGTFPAANSVRTRSRSRDPPTRS